MRRKFIPLLLSTLLIGGFFAHPLAAQETPPAPSPAPAKNASPWEAFFPDGLIKAGEKSDAATSDHFRGMKGKFVGVYNSASWCGPCRALTPKLVAFYKKNKKNIEIVFLSGDRSEDGMIKYAKSDKMKWLAVPFGKRTNTKRSGSLPHLVIYDPNGNFLEETLGTSKSAALLERLPSVMQEWRKENKNKR